VYAVEVLIVGECDGEAAIFYSSRDPSSAFNSAGYFIDGALPVTLERAKNSSLIFFFPQKKLARRQEKRAYHLTSQ
jgi:hypothetical protein